MSAETLNLPVKCDYCQNPQSCPSVKSLEITATIWKPYYHPDQYETRREYIYNKALDRGCARAEEIKPVSQESEGKKT